MTNSAAVKEYCNQLSKVDVLFNVAGWVPHGSVLDSSEEEWNKCMDLNVTSMFRMERVHSLKLHFSEIYHFYFSIFEFMRLAHKMYMTSKP